MTDLEQLTAWKIAVSEDAGNLRFFSAIPGTPTADQKNWMRDRKDAILDALRQRATRPWPPADAAVSDKDRAISAWKPPAAFLSHGGENPAFWVSLAQRLILEAPQAVWQALHGEWSRRLAFWIDCGVEIPEQMAYVDLACIVEERHRVMLAVWFTPEVRVEAVREGVVVSADVPKVARAIPSLPRSNVPKPAVKSLW